MTSSDFFPPGSQGPQPGRLFLRSGPAHATIATHGAQPLSWFCRGRERLYVSPAAIFEPGHAIRGGIPLIFPQFGDRGPGPRHGFARLREWRGTASSPSEARLTLADDEGTRLHWPYAFRAELHVVLDGDSLSVALAIDNTGPEVFSFSAALHTYLRVADLRDARLCGLEGRTFLDSARDGMEARDSAALSFEGEIDRIYPGVGVPLLLDDADGTMRLEQTGFSDVVVWNPGAEIASRLGDLGDGEHRRFVCVEAANVLVPVQLGPGASWTGVQTLTALA